jgi:hypothetical protein
MALYEPVGDRKLAAPQLTLFAVWLFITACGAYLRPDPSGHGTHTQLGLPPCPCVLLFHRPCPGCGLTTSFTAFIHGNFRFAFHAHPLGPFIYLGITFWALLGLYGFVRGLRLDGSGRRFNQVITTFAIIFFAFGITRLVLTPNYNGPTEASYVAALGK